MEIIIILSLVACIVWLLWKLRIKIRAENEAALGEAWRVVLNDPNYLHRRRDEERRRDAE